MFVYQAYIEVTLKNCILITEELHTFSKSAFVSHMYDNPGVAPLHLVNTLT